MSMHRNKFKFQTSLLVVFSHIMILGIALYFHFNFGFGEGGVFEVLSSLIPLFGLFLVIIVKDTISNQYDLTSGRLINLQMVWITRVILFSYFTACIFTFILYRKQIISTPAELASWIAIIEAALGVSLGLLIDSLFGGSSEPQE